MLISMLLTVAAQAAPVPPAAQPAPAPSSTRICRATQAPTGSHMRVGKKCRTAEQWAEEDRRKTLVPPSMQVLKAGDKVTESPAK